MRANGRRPMMPPMNLNQRAAPTPPVVVRVPKHLAHADAEALVERIRNGGCVVLDVTEFERSRLLGDSALLGLLVLARGCRTRVEVRLGGRLPPAGEGARGRYWRLFLESSAGLILAQLSEAVFDATGADVTHVVRRAQAEALRKENGFVGYGKEVTAAIVDRFARPTVADLIRDADVSRFGVRLWSLLTGRLGLDQRSAHVFQPLCDFAHEAMQNTRDHGATDLDERPLEGIRFIQLRRINTSEEPLPSLHDGGEGDVVAEYVRALETTLAESGADARHLVEVTIADGGVGIPARMAGNVGIYRGDIDVERSLLHVAFSAGGSSKATSIAGRGLGLAKVLDATRRLRGLLVVRTGRLCLYRHFLKEPGGAAAARSTRALRANDPPELIDWQPHRAPRYMPGTAVSLLMPWAVRAAAAQQLPLPFEPRE